VLVLAVLVAGLAAFIWFFERDLPSSEELAERSRKVLAVEPDEVTAVAVEWNGGAVRLERERPPEPADAKSGGEGGEGGEAGEEPSEPAEPTEPAGAASGEWRITEPIEARAERSMVDGLLTALAGLDKERTIEGADRAEMGLADPRGRVTLVTGDGERTLEIGADVPASENVLVGLAGEADVWVTPRSFLTQLERPPGEWRARDVLSVARDDVARLRLEAGADPVVLARRDGRFYVEQPVEDLAAADAVDQLLSDLVTLRAQRFLDASGGEAPPPPGRLGLDPPRAVVVAELAKGGEPLRIELGAPVDPSGAGGAVYARAAGQLFEAVTGLDEAAARPVADWRSRSWTELASYEVDRIEVSEPGAPALTLVREGVDWRRGDETVPYTAASDFLFALTDTEGELADEAAPPATSPALTVILGSEKAGAETLILFAPAVGGASLARSSTRGTLLRLSAEEVAKVRRALEAVRSAEPVAKEPAAAEDEEP
jgi:hypothetical protein